jgi:tRNA (pseudouridine54-N1)-methyltransferase
VFARKAWTKPFNLNDLVNAGRMDVIARCISSALFISYAIRNDTNIYISLNGPPNPPILLKFFGDRLKGIYYDERSVAGKINEALKKIYKVKEESEIEVSEGFFVSKESFESFLKKKAKESRIIYLHEEGRDIREVEFSGNEIFVLGDHKGLPEKTEMFLKKLNVEKISLGPLSYLASHCIVIVHNELDRKGL